MSARALWLIAFTALTLCAQAEPALQRFVYEKAEMGLPFRLTFYAPDEASAKAAADAAFERIAVLNSILSDYDPESEISRLSRTSGEGRAVPVSTPLWRVLVAARHLSTRTEGAFDITVGPLVNTWRRARRKQELPSQELLAEMRARVGWAHLHLDPAQQTVKLDLPEMRLDVGSIGKAFAVDEALAVLKSRGFPQALVAGSGDMAAGDPPPDLPGWKIEVATPKLPGVPERLVVWLRNRGVATSGDLFQRVEIDGKRYSHIIDPRTGWAQTDQCLATVFAPDCFTANGLSTSINVLGPERGLPLVEETAGTAARVIRKPGETVEVTESRRWKDEPRAN